MIPCPTCGGFDRETCECVVNAQKGIPAPGAVDQAGGETTFVRHEHSFGLLYPKTGPNGEPLTPTTGPLTPVPPTGPMATPNLGGAFKNLNMQQLLRHLAQMNYQKIQK